VSSVFFNNPTFSDRVKVEGAYARGLRKSCGVRGIRTQGSYLPYTAGALYQVTQGQRCPCTRGLRQLTWCQRYLRTRLAHAYKASARGLRGVRGTYAQGLRQLTQGSYRTQQGPCTKLYRVRSVLAHAALFQRQVWAGRWNKAACRWRPVYVRAETVAGKGGGVERQG
jgi:hypothetical protein